MVQVSNENEYFKYDNFKPIDSINAIQRPEIDKSSQMPEQKDVEYTEWNRPVLIQYSQKISIIWKEILETNYSTRYQNLETGGTATLAK